MTHPRHFAFFALRARKQADGRGHAKLLCYTSQEPPSPSPLDPDQKLSWATRIPIPNLSLDRGLSQRADSRHASPQSARAEGPIFSERSDSTTRSGSSSSSLTRTGAPCRCRTSIIRNGNQPGTSTTMAKGGPRNRRRRRRRRPPALGPRTEVASVPSQPALCQARHEYRTKQLQISRERGCTHKTRFHLFRWRDT